jgi:hypothetical protein
VGSGVPAVPRRRRLTAAAAAAAALIGGFAAAPAVEASTPVTAGAASAPVGAAVAPSHAGAIRELVDLTGALDRELARVDAVVAQLRTTTPDLPDAVWTNYAARLRDREALLARYVPVYARHLDEADTRALAAFYRTPLGRRTLDAQAAIAEDSRAASERLVRAAFAGETVSPAPDGTPPAHAGAVRELLDTMGVVPAAQESMRRTIASLRAVPAFAAIEPAEWDRVVATLTDPATLYATWVPAYARHMPAADARELTGFYRSPLGRRVAAALPAIQADLTDVARDYGTEAARRAVREVLGPLPQWRPRP